MQQSNLDTLLPGSNLPCCKLLQVFKYGSRFPGVVYNDQLYALHDTYPEVYDPKAGTWNRSRESPFRPRSFWTNCYPQVLDKIPSIYVNHRYINL
jgi:hypothetical protein